MTLETSVPTNTETAESSPQDNTEISSNDMQTTSEPIAESSSDDKTEDADEEDNAEDEDDIEYLDFVQFSACAEISKDNIEAEDEDTDTDSEYADFVHFSDFLDVLQSDSPAASTPVKQTDNNSQEGEKEDFDIHILMKDGQDEEEEEDSVEDDVLTKFAAFLDGSSPLDKKDDVEEGENKSNKVEFSAFVDFLNSTLGEKDNSFDFLRNDARSAESIWLNVIQGMSSDTSQDAKSVESLWHDIIRKMPSNTSHDAKSAESLWHDIVRGMPSDTSQQEMEITGIPPSWFNSICAWFGPTDMVKETHRQQPEEDTTVSSSFCESVV